MEKGLKKAIKYNEHLNQNEFTKSVNGNQLKILNPLKWIIIFIGNEQYKIEDLTFSKDLQNINLIIVGLNLHNSPEKCKSYQQICE
jgi:hypothetical protein